VSFRKYALYFNDLDHNDYINQCINTIENVKEIDIYQSQCDELKDFWEFSKIDILDNQNPELNSSIHYNLYQLYTSGGGNSRVNIPAKGLSGEGYEGHTFWDTEIYMLPFFMQVNTDLAKSLLSNRYRQMDEARAEAKKLGVNHGVKFAWRTISGKETSPYFLAGQAQYHINSDIAYSFIKNYQLHNDEDYFIKYGLPVLIETSRFFSDIVVKKNNQYHIHNVTGPDEYTTMVNNNYYTNSMIKYQLNFLVNFLNDKKSKVKKIIETYHLSKNEIELFDHISENIYLPFDKDLNIDLQDDSFLTKEKWDFKTTSKNNYPLLLHYHPLKIYRHQVLKQPDAVLSHFLLNNRPTDIMKSSFDYYEALTTHDSSLSRCIHALQAARLGDAEKSYRYFLDTVYLDLDNVQKNTEYGLHVANLGGVYLTLLNGFLGLNISENISIKPNLPKHINYLNMNIRLYNDTIINVALNHNEIVLKANKKTKIILDDEEICINQIYRKKIVNDN
jgi:alpha,alpha-trehalose phosphorylase